MLGGALLHQQVAPDYSQVYRAAGDVTRDVVVAGIENGERKVAARREEPVAIAVEIQPAAMQQRQCLLRQPPVFLHRQPHPSVPAATRRVYRDHTATLPRQSPYMRNTQKKLADDPESGTSRKPTKKGFVPGRLLRSERSSRTHHRGVMVGMMMNPGVAILAAGSRARGIHVRACLLACVTACVSGHHVTRSPASGARSTLVWALGRAFLPAGRQECRPHQELSTG